MHAGTSGWMYPHWVDYLYPRNMPKGRWLEYISGFINSIEINNTFYRQPTEPDFIRWHLSVPDNFIFSIKANRAITHEKRLLGCETELTNFLDASAGLKNKIGALLFQLPPSFQKDTERLKNFIRLLPSGFRYTMEFRNNTWWTEDVYTILKQRNIAFTLFQISGRITPNIITADFVYIRLHGQLLSPYTGEYQISTLKAWARLINKWREAGKDVYIYFDNDQKAYAFYDAIKITDLISGRIS